MARVAVIGQTVVRELFRRQSDRRDDPDRQRGFRVKGVLPAKGTSPRARTWTSVSSFR